ncbi:MAG: hypothetical protein H0U75_12645 [Legionella sp.]|nr:hypothetical protein [Legionella sp.]
MPKKFLFPRDSAGVEVTEDFRGSEPLKSRSAENKSSDKQLNTSQLFAKPTKPFTKEETCSSLTEELRLIEVEIANEENAKYLKILNDQKEAIRQQLAALNTPQNKSSSLTPAV